MRWILPVVLLAACAGASALPTADPPATDDLSGLISQPAPGWKLEHWFNSEPLALEDLRGKVVLVRWFMAPSCPFCSATAPALNRLDPLRTLAAGHRIARSAKRNLGSVPFRHQ